VLAPIRRLQEWAPAVRAWAARQWVSIVLIGTGWALMIGAVRLDQASDELATATLALGALLVALGCLHHRGFKGTAGPQGLKVDVPPAPDPATARLAELPAVPADALSEDEADEGALFLIGMTTLTTRVLHPLAPLDDCRGQVWLFDSNAEALTGILEPGHEGTVSFEIGQGAVGRAWAENIYVLASGEAVINDPSFRLTEQHRDRFSNLTAAAAMPVTNAAGDLIAVVSLSSTSQETLLETEVGLEFMIFASELVARVLVDIFKWFDDA
jgi:hypothetical protein